MICSGYSHALPAEAGHTPSPGDKKSSCTPVSSSIKAKDLLLVGNFSAYSELMKQQVIMVQPWSSCSHAEPSICSEGELPVPTGDL